MRMIGFFLSLPPLVALSTWSPAMPTCSIWRRDSPVRSSQSRNSSNEWLLGRAEDAAPEEEALQGALGLGSGSPRHVPALRFLLCLGTSPNHPKFGRSLLRRSSPTRIRRPSARVRTGLRSARSTRNGDGIRSADSFSFTDRFLRPTRHPGITPIGKDDMDPAIVANLRSSD